MPRRVPDSDTRPLARIRDHYEIEKGLALTLRNASTGERRRLYTEVYDELLQRVPDHPMLVSKHDAAVKAHMRRNWLACLRPLLHPEATYLEVGPGDCNVAFGVASEVRRVIAADVSHEITRSRSVPENFSLVISDGCSIPVPEGSVDVAFSNQLMEHLHPDDARLQLDNIYRALKPGGVYVCCTPNRLSGPHDVSQYFQDTPGGFHLREYTSRELEQMFRAAGFVRFRYFAVIRGRAPTVPGWLVRALESGLAILPAWLSRPLSRLFPVPWLLGVNLMAWKRG